MRGIEFAIERALYNCLARFLMLYDHLLFFVWLQDKQFTNNVLQQQHWYYSWHFKSIRWQPDERIWRSEHHQPDYESWSVKDPSLSNRVRWSQLAILVFVPRYALKAFFDVGATDRNTCLHGNRTEILDQICLWMVDRQDEGITSGYSGLMDLLARERLRSPIRSHIHVGIKRSLSWLSSACWMTPTDRPLQFVVPARRTCYQAYQCHCRLFSRMLDYNRCTGWM